MLIRVMIGLVLLTALSGSALADETIVKYFERARILREEGKIEEAIDAFRLVIREWPDDAVYTPQAHVLLIEALIDANRIDDARHTLRQTTERYRGWEKLLEQTGKLSELLQERVRRLQARKQDDREMAKVLEALERRLKAEGLSGEELSRAFQEAKRQIETERHFAEAREQYERVKKLWETQGVSPDEIRERAKRIEEERDHLVREAKDLQRLARRLQEEGASAKAIERELEERRRDRAAERDGPWKERHEEEMHRIRREFIHLAEELGIPGDEAERFLEEHRKGRDRLDVDADLHRRLAEMEERFEMRTAEFEQVVRKLNHRIEILEHRLGKLLERRRDDDD